jgi:hypothetical protein
MTPTRERLGKHCLKAGIKAEAEVDLLDNGTCFRFDKSIPVKRNRITGDN